MESLGDTQLNGEACDFWIRRLVRLAPMYYLTNIESGWQLTGTCTDLTGIHDTCSVGKGRWPSPEKNISLAEPNQRDQRTSSSRGNAQRHQGSYG